MEEFKEEIMKMVVGILCFLGLGVVFYVINVTYPVTNTNTGLGNLILISIGYYALTSKIMKFFNKN